MRLGLHYWTFSTPTDTAAIAPALSETARIADDGGLASFTVMDHYFQMEQTGPAEQPMLEAYTTLGYVAALTRRMTLGVLVTGVIYRYPGLLAKIVTTLDVLSNGRGRLGIGASWYEREQRGARRARGAGAGAVRTARGDPADLPADVERQRRAVQRPPLPARRDPVLAASADPTAPAILIGGGGEKRTLLLVARYADACNVFATSPADVAHKLDVLRRHCDDEGSNYDSITKTALYVGPPVLDNTDRFLADAEQYATLGITELEVMPDRDPVEFAAQLVDRISPRLDAIG